MGYALISERIHSFIHLGSQRYILGYSLNHICMAGRVGVEQKVACRLAALLRRRVRGMQYCNLTAAAERRII